MEPQPGPGRRRPRLHFTPRIGWLGDPHGVVPADGGYHLYYQHHAASTAWDPAVVWGHATSRDLVLWVEQPVALAPEPGEVGCWSGSVVTGPDGPTLFYTRVATGEPATGQVARAVGRDYAAWRRDPPASVITGPPPGVGEMRDPSVRAVPGGWRMVLGGRLDSGAAAAVQYSSADTCLWACDGVLVTGPDTMWECPQFFELDGVWVLIVSARHGVRYALGDYDGRAFTARTWGEFGRGQIYATTTFRDAQGRRCAISWLRERDDRPPDGSPWSGALSLPWVLSVRDDRLLAAPHPHLDRYLVDGGSDLRVAGGRLLDGDDPLLDLPPGGEVTAIVDADLVEVAVEGVSGVAAVRRRDDGAAGVRLLRFSSSQRANARR